MNATMSPVVLGVGGADPVSNVAAMEFALDEARQRGVPVEVVHGCRPRHQLIPTDSWVESEQHNHGRRIVGGVAQQLRRMSRYEVQVRVTNTDTSGVDALLTASASASVVVLQAPARPHTSQVAAPGSTIRAVVARAACPVVVLRRQRAVGTGRGIVVGVEEHGRAQGAVLAAVEQAARRQRAGHRRARLGRADGRSGPLRHRAAHTRRGGLDPQRGRSAAVGGSRRTWRRTFPP